MAKKNLKRGLALGALMAFVITGSAMAGEFTNHTITSGTYDGDSFKLTNEGSSYNIDADAASITISSSDVSIDVKNNTDGNVWAVDAYAGGKISIGNSNAKIISITVSNEFDGELEGNTIGVFSHGNENAEGGLVDLNAEKIEISAKGKESIGTWVQSGTEHPTAPSKHSVMNVNAKTIKIISDYIGISASSNGEMNVTGDLNVVAKNVIDVRGNSTVNINKDGKYGTKLTGDIVFETPNDPTDAKKSGKLINAFVNVNLNGADSVWEGRSYQEYKVLNDSSVYEYKKIVELEADPYHGNVTGFNVELNNGAKWINTAESFVNTLTINGGSVQFVDETEKQPATNIGVLKGSGAIFNMKNASTIKVKSFENDDVTLNAGTIKFVGGDTKITGKLTLNKGANISESENAPAMNLTFANGSKLVIDNLNNYLKEYNGVETYAVIEAERGTVTAEKGATVSIGAADEGTYTIVKANKVVNNMTDEDVTFDGGLKTGTWINKATEMNLKVAIKDLKQESDLVPSENADLIENALRNINTLENNPNTQQLGDFYRMISQLAELANSSNSDSAKADIKAALSSSAQGGMNNGAASTATSIVNNVAGLTSGHMSIAAPAPQGGSGVGLFEENSGAGVWAQYLHGKDKADEMPSGSSKNKYSNSYNGILVGADFKQVNKFQSGVAFSYTDGSGSSSSTTDGVLGSTGHTEFKSYGFTYYGAIKNDTVNTMFDLGYNHSKADSDTNILLTGHKDSSTSKTHTWTAGVTVEKSFIDGKNGAQFIPYAGVRYMNISTDDFTTKMGYQNSMDDQNVFMIPVGIKFRQENTYKSGWRVTPKADLSYVWAVGDTDNDVNVTISGLPNGTSKIGYTVMDKGSFLGTVGVEASKNNWTYGVSYSYQKGEHQRSDKYFVDVKYSF